jgi:hypothetical protein
MADALAGRRVTVPAAGGVERVELDQPREGASKTAPMKGDMPWPPR